MKIKQLLKIIFPYCRKITYNSKHYVCYPKDCNTIITISATSSDCNFYRQVFMQFRANGVIIKELQKYL